VNTGRNILAVAALIALYSSEAVAEDVKVPEKPVPRRLCKPQDLEGTYLLVSIDEKPENKEMEWHRRFPYKYMSFHKPDTFSSLYMHNQVDSAAKLDALLKTIARQGTNKYSLSDDGVLYLYTNSKISYTYRCIASLMDADGYKKGDLILSGYGSKGKTELRELYRHWY
jgi:hypothetical protein